MTDSEAVREALMSYETAIYLIGQHAFDWFTMRDGSPDQFDGLVRGVLDKWSAQVRADERKRYEVLVDALRKIRDMPGILNAWDARVIARAALTALKEEAADA